MLLALDSYYLGDVCNTSLVIFENNPYSSIYYTDTVYTDVTSEYVPGKFYKRELPGIKVILKKLIREHPELWTNVNAIIVDSFVRLKSQDKEWDGLGQHLYDWLESIGQHKIVWGVAKTKFGDCDKISRLVYRGVSKNPLYVQSTGDIEVAAETIKNLGNAFDPVRIPNVLKHVDQLSRIF